MINLSISKWCMKKNLYYDGTHYLIITVLILVSTYFLHWTSHNFVIFSTTTLWHENLNLLVRIKFLNLFLCSSLKKKLKNLLVRIKFYWFWARGLVLIVRTVLYVVLIEGSNKLQIYLQLIWTSPGLITCIWDSPFKKRMHK
jgi:hypothetical protein